MSPQATAARLRAAGSRITRQRLLVADELSAAGGQVAAQELFERLRRRDPSIGRATVFRALEALVAAGAARRLEGEGHTSGYVACRRQHHHHLACDRCGLVEEIGESFIRPMAERLAAERGFRIDDARLDFYGLCSRCLDEEAG